MKAKRSPAPFTTNVPRRALLKLYAAVFCIFAPMMILSISSAAQHHTAPAVLTWFFLSGAIAVCWAAAFIHKRKWLFAVVPAQFVLVCLFVFRVLPGLSPGGAALSVEGIGSVIMLVAGYVAFVQFIRGEGARGMRLQAEMDLAQQIHESLVPDVDETTTAFEIVGRSEPSSEMGGDLLYAARNDEASSIDVYLGDVSGHGVKPGIVMAMIKSAIRMRRRLPARLDELLSDVNRVLVELTDPGMFATFVALRLHDSGVIEYSHAGHPALLHHRAADGAMDERATEGLPLGVVDDAEYATARVATQPGDVLAVYTDGVIEVFDARGEQLGWGGFQELVQRHVGEPSLANAVSAIWDDVRAFNRGGAQDDDQSVVLIRRRAQ
ncbi:MAG: serine/threonine-protein phosphatase [Phycisphaerales bacterium]|nr:serine/threonine-protein phosphatase [Phycisphaerales bacterium]